jgi:damage-control phosphatase, subfamily I
MKTYLECIPCFFRQALEASQIAGTSIVKQKEILDKVAVEIPLFSLAATPPEMGRLVHDIVRKITKKKDPYLKVKAKSNKLALGIKNDLKNKVRRSKNRLLTAVELAIAGNIIDYGVKNTLDVNKELNKILSKEEKIIKKEDPALFQFKQFKSKLSKAKTILYLGDNVGETVFDSILLEEIKEMYPEKEIEYAVRAAPIINDALAEDAYKAGLDQYAKIITSGVDAPGTILSLCSQTFLKKFNNADLIISKGQGNYEALSQESGPIFFLFMAKCPVIAKHLNCDIGNIILKKI